LGEFLRRSRGVAELKEDPAEVEGVAEWLREATSGDASLGE